MHHFSFHLARLLLTEEIVLLNRPSLVDPSSNITISNNSSEFNNRSDEYSVVNDGNEENNVTPASLESPAGFGFQISEHEVLLADTVSQNFGVMNE